MRTNQGELSWRQLDRGTEAVARRLAGLGVRPGQRVAIPLAADRTAAEILFAFCRLGAVLVPLAPFAPKAEHDALAVRAKVDQSLTVEEITEAEPAGGYDHRAAAVHEPWCIIYTSGSTGRPKGTILSRENLDSNAAGTEAALRVTPQDRWLACLPFHRIGGLSIFVRSARTGFSVVPFPQARFDPEAVADAISRDEVTMVSLVPTMLHRMMEAGWSGSPWLRVVLLGGAPCPEPLMNEARARQIPIAPTYGLTEAASQVTTLVPWDSSDHHGTAGTPLPDVSIHVGEDPSAEAPLETPGPIWVSGPTVALASLDGPLTNEAGWLATGDIGSVDANGYLTVLGRADDIIITGGEKVVPSEVEAAIISNPGIREAVVLGVSDPEWGERVVATVTTVEGAAIDEASLRAFLKDKLDPHKVPRRILFVAADLPVSGSGKVDRGAVRRIAEEGE